MWYSNTSHVLLCNNVHTLILLSTSSDIVHVLHHSFTFLLYLGVCSSQCCVEPTAKSPQTRPVSIPLCSRETFSWLNVDSYHYTIHAILNFSWPPKYKNFGKAQILKAQNWFKSYWCISPFNITMIHDLQNPYFSLKFTDLNTIHSFEFWPFMN